MAFAEALPHLSAAHHARDARLLGYSAIDRELRHLWSAHASNRLVTAAGVARASAVGSGHTDYRIAPVQCRSWGMPTVIADIARAASDAARRRTSFEARQSIRAGRIAVSARVRFRVPDLTLVEYASYVSPFAEMEDVLGGYAELAPEDLSASILTYDGRVTRAHNPTTATQLVSPGRRLYEPIPGMDALAEVAFLDDLTRDYLLRDGGETVHNGRPARVIGLKPKRLWTSSVFRTKAFLLERADVTLDAETFFPLAITFVPGRDTPAAAALAGADHVTIEYTDVREADIEESTFVLSVPTGTRVFTESAVPAGAADLPFPLPLEAAAAAGLELVDDRALLVLDEERARGYATVVFRRAAGEGREDALVVRVGNFISRLMARRRTLAADRGESVDVRGVSGRYVDRRALLGSDAATRGLPPLADVTWEAEGLYWVLSTEGLTRDEALAAAADLV